MIATDFGTTVSVVGGKRRKLGIAPPQRCWRRWTPEGIIALLGTATDREIAERLGLSFKAAKSKRHQLGITAYRRR